jgi:CHAT domain-containing protein
MAKLLLALMTAFLCMVVSPVLAKAPAVHSAVQNLTSDWLSHRPKGEAALAAAEGDRGRTQDLVQQGKTLYKAGQFAEAVNVLQQAAAAFRASGDGLREAMTLSNLSLAYQQLGLWAEAEKAIAQSLNLLQNLDNSKERSAILAQTLDVQGQLQLALSKAEAALTTWQRAADIYQQIGDSTALTRNRINSAQALQSLGLFRQAKKILTEVEQTLKNQPDSLLKATGLRSLGNVLQVVGDLKESRRVLEQSLALVSSSSSERAVSETLFSLGNTARAQRETKAALDYYQQAASASADPFARIQAQLNQLSLLIETKRFPDALVLSSRIQPEISNLPPSRMAVDAKINFAQSLMKLGRGDGRAGEAGEEAPSAPPTVLGTSAQVLAQAVGQAQSLQDKPAESSAIGTLGELYEKAAQFSDAQKLTEKALFIAQSINASDIAYQWQWQLGRILKQQRDIKGALAYYSEAFKTLQSLRSDLVAINPDVQFSFRESVEPVYRELVELLLQPPQTPYQGGDSGSSLGMEERGGEPDRDNLKQARFVIESLQLAELDNFFRSACLSSKQDLDPLIDQKDQQAAVIYPIILPNSLHVILKLPNQGLRHYRTLIAQDKVEGIVQNLRKYLLDVTRIARIKQQSQQIYDWLIRPAEAELAKSGIKTLVFVLDGELRNVPMAVLYDKQQQKYLVQKYAIALAPGLQLLDPKPLQQVRLNVLAAGVEKERSLENREFLPLENVPRELDSIQSEVPKSEKLLNQQFTETNLQNQLMAAPFSVVHLATHGEFSSDPEKTFILTWDTLLNVKKFDGLLRNSDENRSSTIELLVLSACKTAEGDKRAALGLAGVAVRAGARSTLATLWSVDDRSTADVMSEFYRELNAGVNKAEALQRAQLAVFAKEKSPYFWAPFVLLGNWL